MIVAGIGLGGVMLIYGALGHSRGKGGLAFSLAGAAIAVTLGFYLAWFIKKTRN